MTLRPLRHQPLDIRVNAGRASADEAREALGAFLLAHAGYPTDIGIRQLCMDEAYEFDYKGRTWRFQFILILDVRIGKRVPFRIDLDYLRQVEQPSSPK